MLREWSMSRACCLTAVVLLLALLGSCHGFFTSPVLTSITVSPANPSVQVGHQQQFTANGNFDDGTTGSVSGASWSSSDTTVASISSFGLATAASSLPSGSTSKTTTITATSGSMSGTATMTVRSASVTSITISPASQTLSLSGTGGFNRTVQLTANATFSDGSSGAISATWSTNPTGIVSIDQNGLATAQAVGTTSVTATDPSTGIASVTPATLVVQQ